MTKETKQIYRDKETKIYIYKRRERDTFDQRDKTDRQRKGDNDIY